MPTDLCRWCGTTYDLIHGHSCTPTTTTSGTGPQSEEVPDGRRLGLEGRAPATTAAPTDFQQAIQDLLYPDEDGFRSCAGCGAIPGRGHVDPCPVEQFEVLLRDLTDRNTNLEVYAAELRDAAKTFLGAYQSGSWNQCWEAEEGLRAVLAVEPPRQARQLQDKVERLERFEQAVRKAATWNYDTATAMLVDEALRALDQGEAQEGDSSG